MKKITVILCTIFVLVPLYARAGFILGVGVHQNSDKNIQIVKGIGLKSVRNDFNWQGVEKEKGILTLPPSVDTYLQTTSEASIAPLMILDYGNKFYDGGGKPVTPEGIGAFANFAKFSGTELAGKVKYFEIWNEWDHSKYPTSAESYFELVKAAAPSIKSNNKNAVVLAGAATFDAMRNGWVEKLVQLGVLNYANGISIHPYVHCEPDNRPEAWIYSLSQFSSKLKKANGGKEVPLYITEMGWPSNNGACGSSPEKVAQYLARALLWVRTLPEVKGLWWYDLKNDGTNIADREQNFGLLDYDYAPKPAFKALRDIAPLILNGRVFTRLQAPSGLLMMSIIDANGSKSFALWSAHGNAAEVTCSIASEEKTSFSVLKVGADKALYPHSKKNIQLTVDGTPLVFTGGIRDLRIVKTVW
ncbi:MAG TPA: hypothetical protein VI298_12535 [Geobacteraceae bacterium]